MRTVEELTRSQTSVQIWDRIMALAYTSIGSQTGNKIRGQISDRLWRPVERQTRMQLANMICLQIEGPI